MAASRYMVILTDTVIAGTKLSVIVREMLEVNHLDAALRIRAERDLDSWAQCVQALIESKQLNDEQ